MTTKELLNIRLENQLLTGNGLRKAEEIVGYMGAMQAQTFEMAKWGIGVRSESLNRSGIEQAIDAGKIVRLHILRPTWHFVAAEDLHWMSDLSLPRIKPIYIGYCRSCGLDEAVIRNSFPLIEKALEGNNHLTGAEIGAELNRQGVRAEASDVRCILSRAEVEGIVCSGKMKGKNPTYALKEEWVPRREHLTAEEAQDRLARRFFTSHGPATLQDFVWWSGLTLTDARRALNGIKEEFTRETLNGREFWMKKEVRCSGDGSDSALLLPPFDEFVVSYKDRSELIGEEHYGKVMTKNGLFSPTVMLNGEIVGAWKKETGKGKTGAAVSFFEKTAKKTEKLFLAAGTRLGDFFDN